jgi:hypothetical protein
MFCLRKRRPKDKVLSFFEVIAEEVLHRQKALAAVERGKAQISTRAGANKSTF